jgi:hypothetical protein
MIAGNKRQYFWSCCAFVCLVICDHAAGDLTNAFSIAVLRVQQTGMGILVYTLVSMFLWPTSSRSTLHEATRKLVTTQATIYRTYRALLSGNGKAEESRPLRMQEIQLLGQWRQTRNAAETDSYEVWEVRHQWRQFQCLSTALMEALEQWRESFSEVRSLDLKKLLPNLETVLSELDGRFTEIERMLSDESPTRTPKQISLVIENKEALTHTHFQKAAVAVTKTQLDRLEMLSRALFDCVRDVKGFGPQSPEPFMHDIRHAFEYHWRSEPADLQLCRFCEYSCDGSAGNRDRHRYLVYSSVTASREGVSAPGGPLLPAQRISAVAPRPGS